MADGAPEDSPVVSLPRVVDVTPFTPTLRWVHLRKWLAHIGDEVLSVALFTVAIVGLLAPPAIFLVSSLWSMVNYISGILTLWHEVKTWRINDMLTSLTAIDASLRFALAGVSYFAVVFSLIVLFAGLLGRRWQRVFVVPGVLLCALNVVIFTLAASLSFSVLVSHLHLVGWLQYPLISYALLDALLLAVLLLDLRPSSRHRWPARRRHRGEAPAESATSNVLTPLPMVRFGPSHPLAATDASDTISQPAAVQAISSSAVESEHEAIPAISVTPEEVTEDAPDMTNNTAGAKVEETVAALPAEAEARVAAD